MINSELLKTAIADAKAVRATALLNAKAALEEAFAPRFEAMFAEKLKEEAEEEQEEGMMQEVEAPNQVSGKGGEAKGPHTKAVTKGNPKKVSDGNTNFKTVHMGQGPTDVPKADNKIDEAAEEEEEGKKVDEQYQEEEGKVEESGLTSEDLDEIIKELENEVDQEENGRRPEASPMAEFPPSQQDPSQEEPAPEGDVAPPSPMMGGEEGEPEGSEADVEAEPGSEVDINLGPEAGEEAGAFPPIVGDEEGEAQAPPVSPFPKKDENNINLEELISALNENGEEEDEGKEEMDEQTEEEDEGKEEMDETTKNHGLPKNVGGQDKTSGTNTYPKGPDASKKQLPGKNHNISGKGNIGTGAVGGKPMREETQYKVALKEAYKTIEFLRGQINEVNLLNAKLLYTNKLFKEFAGVLDDNYRMKVVESFDLTKSVREVKLAYALLAESLNFGTHVAKAREIVKPSSKPVSSTKGQVKQITEGFASKPVSSTKPSQVITEGVNEMALRFKKLAGIKEAPTSEKK